MKHREPPVQSAPREVRYDQGTHWRAQLGFIVISTDLVMEENIFRLAPAGVGTSIARLNSAGTAIMATLATSRATTPPRTIFQ